MDVRCERCKTDYVVDDGLVDEGGLAVRCSKCGHTFRVTRAPSTPAGEPPAAAAAGREPPAAAGVRRGTRPRPRGGTLRKAAGDLYPFDDVATLQRWIVERKASPEDEVSRDGGRWERLADLPEYEPFFDVVERADRATPALPEDAQGEPGGAAVLVDEGPALERAEPAGPVKGVPVAAAGPEPTGGGPVVRGAPAATGGSDRWEVPARAPASDEPAWAAEVPSPVTRAKPRPVKGLGTSSGSRLAWILVGLVLLVGGIGVAAYLVDPALVGLGPVQPPPVPAPAPSPAAAEATPPPPAAAPPAPAPAPSPEPPPQQAQVPGAIPGMPPPGPGAPAETGAAAAPVAGTPPPGPPTTGSATTGSATTQNPPAEQAAGAPQPGQPASAAPPTAGSREPPPAPASAAGAPAGRPEPPTAGPRAAPVTPSEPVAAPRPETAAPPGGPAAGARPPKAEAPRPEARPAKDPKAEVKGLITRARRLRERGNAEAALDTYGRALELDPRSADALAGRGACYLDMTRYAQAEASFKEALEVDGGNASALMGLAETYRYEGRRADAVTYYRRYLATHSSGEDAVAARNAISALEESP